MIEKTKGIILNQIKYTDSGIIARVYTHKFGRQSLLIRGMRKKNTGRQNVLFQPLTILEFEMNYKASRELQNLKEFSVFYSPSDIYSNIKKSSVAIFLSEILTSVLKEESPNEEMFTFLEESVIYFDMTREGYANFHIAFLAGLASFLGFEPGIRHKTEDRFFDLGNGRFVQVPPVNGNYANEEISGILSEFFNASYDSAANIPLNGTLRNEVLETLVWYYSLHLPGLKKINSLEVLKEVFS
jgi:DNA repair protein RecO (recombination protein O)